MKTSVISLVFLLLAATQQCADKQAVWKNPEIICQLQEREKAVRKFPQLEGSATAAEMSLFGKKMQARFAESGMTVQEAEKVYKILEKNTFLKNNSYGMPSPGKEEKVPLKQYLQKIALKKITATQYELYYSYASCGMNYSYLKINIFGEQIVATEPIEAWQGAYPC